MNRIRIVVIDDDEDDREFFKIALEKCKVKYELAECFNGDHFLKFLKKNEAIDFIFLDINMPKVNGLECLKMLQGKENMKNTRIVMLSTASSPLTVQECFALGAAAYIVKPNNSSALESMINYCFRNLDEKRDFKNFILNDYLLSRLEK